MKVKIYLIILFLVLIMVSTLSLILKNKNKNYIYLDECYRVAEECVFFDSKERPIYLSYKDCSVPPRRIKIKNYIFVEK